MENQRTSAAETSRLPNYWVSSNLRTQWEEINSDLPLPHPDSESAHWKIEQIGTDIVLTDRKKTQLKLPCTKSNLGFFAKTLSEMFYGPDFTTNSWENQALIELADLSQPLFFGSLIDADTKNYLSKLSSTISLKSGLDGFFELRRFKEFRIGFLLVHQKGEAQAWQIGAGGSQDGLTSSIDLEKFNSLYQAVKKSKNGQFTTQQPKWQWLPVGGVFLAETFSFRRFNAIWVISRQEFLPCSNEEVREFRSFAKLLGLWLEGLIELEFSDLRLAEIMWALEHCPLPLALQDSQGKAIFTNAAFVISGPPPELSWIPIGKNYELGIGKREDWDATRIDVLHSHKIALLGDLFNTLRHELSNPLFGLGLACELLLGTETPDDVSMVLSEIKKNILRSQLIISNLSKLYSEEHTTNSCDLGQALEETLTLAKSELKTIRKILPPNVSLEGIIVEGRPLLVVQILFNLLINSSQAMRVSTQAPEIKIKEIIQADSVELIISDNGPGLPPLIKENLFRPFYTTKQKGHGLGLALSRDLALKIGGDLNYIEGPLGATFRLQLKRVL